MTPSENRNIRVVHECYADGEADIVVGILREAGVHAAVKSNHTMFPVTAGRLGRIRVYVNEDDLEKARATLAAHSSEDDSDSPSRPSTS